MSMMFIDYLPLLMFTSLGVLLFSGYPVAYILGGLAIVFGVIGYWFDIFELIEFFNFVPRAWGQAAENLTLVAAPLFVFMGVMMERSGVANDMLYVCQVLLRRIPGALALAVTVMGTILAAMTGIIGASVTMLTALALPTMLKQGYHQSLATGVIAASGCLGILIPPSIMLIIVADLLSISVGKLFMAAITPGLILATFYLLYVGSVASLKPSIAPPLPRDMLYVPPSERRGLVMRGFIPPVFLIALIKGSLLLGWAAPSEAGAVGAFGAMVLAAARGRLSWETVKSVCQSSAMTVSMVFLLIVTATCFAYVFRSLGGDDVVEFLILETGFGSWGILIIIMVIIFFLGFFLDWVEIVLIVLPVFAPLVAAMSFGDHVAGREIVYWFAILMAVNLQTSFLTPPFGFALFYMKGIAPKEVRIENIYKGIVPFVIMQLVGMVMVLAWPDVSLWLSRLI